MTVLKGRRRLAAIVNVQNVWRCIVNVFTLNVFAIRTVIVTTVGITRVISMNIRRRYIWRWLGIRRRLTSSLTLIRRRRWRRMGLVWELRRRRSRGGVSVRRRIVWRSIVSVIIVGWNVGFFVGVRSVLILGRQGEGKCDRQTFNWFWFYEWCFYTRYEIWVIPSKALFIYYKVWNWKLKNWNLVYKSFIQSFIHLKVCSSWDFIVFKTILFCLFKILIQESFSH